MLFRFSNDTTSFTVNNINDIYDARLFFPNYKIECCNDKIDYTSYTNYTKTIINTMPHTWKNKFDFINELKKINIALANNISFNPIINVMYLYLDNSTMLSYNYYVEDDLFVIKDLINESTW